MRNEENVRGTIIGQVAGQHWRLFYEGREQARGYGDTDRECMEQAQAYQIALKAENPCLFTVQTWEVRLYA